MTRRGKTVTGSHSIHGHQLQNFISVKYLGVTIPRDLGWDLHIADVTRRASRTLGFVRRNLRLFSRKTKEAAYKALMRPLPEYASPVWNPYTVRCGAGTPLTKSRSMQRGGPRWATSRHPRLKRAGLAITEVWPEKARLITLGHKFRHGLWKSDLERRRYQKDGGGAGLS